MSYDLNQQDIELLKNNPYQFILNHQKLIESIIHLFIRSGRFAFEELNDIKQQVNEELLGKIHKIRDQFHGKSLLTTYLTVIVRNICIEILRKKNKLYCVSLNESIIHYAGDDAINTLVIEEEIDRLQKTIQLYYRQEWKLLLCLKIKFKMGFDFDSFRTIYKQITKADFEDFIGFVQPYEGCSEKTLFIGLARLFNKYEDKEITPDSLRKWVTDKINQIIEVLNGRPPTSKYNRETFQILFEKSFHKEQKVKTD